MKYLLLLLCCLLLTGCGREEPAAPTVPETLPAVEPAPLYEAGSPLELAYDGAVRAYPLPLDDAYGLRAMGENLIVFSGNPTTLTLLSGEDPCLVRSLQLDFPLDQNAPSLQVWENGLSYFDPGEYETVVLDASLTEIRRIAAPLDLVGQPILSLDGRVLYYCTPNAIRGWDLNSGVRRLIKEISFPGQKLTGLFFHDTVLKCTLPEESRDLLVDLLDGRTLWEGQAGATLAGSTERYYASIPTGMHTRYLFGDHQILLPRHFGRAWFMETLHGAVALDFAGQSRELSFYDLDAGSRSSVLTLESGSEPVVEDMGGFVYVLADNVLYRWDVSDLPWDDLEVYTGDAGSHWLGNAQAYAEDIGNRFGIRILIGEEAALAQPWDYDFEAETQTDAVWRQLEWLDESLSHFPRELLDSAIAPFGSLKLCLVRSITGAPESGSVETAHGVQFREDDGAVIALAVGPKSDRALYHELFHIMETRLLSESTAFDQWENLNPKGFTYAMTYVPNPDRNISAHLTGEGRAFIDAYSTTFPKEDRARVMEYAMTPGNAELFRSPILQAKLEALCLGIRDAFGLKKSPESFLWEQYLETS